MPTRAADLRRTFTEHFAARGHVAAEGIGLLPLHPAAPMFTNAGMNKFLAVILAEEPRPDPPRATTVQRCVRIKGRHDDIANIGRSWGHLTLFEMLGNFSFGDYFKAEAIAYAWDLLTGTWGIDGDRLWVTVHDDDDEAAELWRHDVGLPAARIQRLGPDNFWEMGETGPCGPSSEIYFDMGPDHGASGGPAAGAEQRFREVWNLVFMQYHRRPDGSLTELPLRIIDTGAGLERLLTVLDGVTSVFETEELARLVAAAEEVTGRRLGADAEADVSLRILADHGRCATFLVSDGVAPSNEDRGYVLRRIIRRAVRQAFRLEVEGPVMAPLAAATVEVMGQAYPELSLELVGDVLDREEARFRQTLEAGSAMLDDALARVAPPPAPRRGTGTGELEGAVAFKLHDTYGFPLELTLEIAGERGMAVDVAGFEAEMAAQRQRARQAQEGRGADPEQAGHYRELAERFGPTEFVGYDVLAAEGRVVAVAGDEVFLDRTPFYANAGGQVGDTGVLETDTGRARVLDTPPAVAGVRVHRVAVVEGEILPGQAVRAAVDAERRDHLARNHTGTHLLHWALRDVLGPHVRQHGSYVGPERLRFDFSHTGPLDVDEVAEVERRANRAVLANDAVRAYETSREEAAARGALAFFEERYGELVRVVEAGPSLELCGGTHVGAVGAVGPVKVAGESSIGAGIRRVEALTGLASLERVRDTDAVLARVAALLRVAPQEVVEGIERLAADYRQARDELAALRREAAVGRAAALGTEATDGVVVSHCGTMERGDLQDLAVAVRDLPGIRAVVLGAAPPGGGAALVAAVRGDGGLDAGALLTEAARAVGGGAGRGRDLSMAGGRHPERLDEALALARQAALGA